MEQYQNGITGFQRYMEIMDENKEKDKANAIKLDTVEGEI